MAPPRDALQRDGDITKIRNLHVKTRDGVVHKNDVRPAVPRDELPPPDPELYYKYPFCATADEAVRREHGLPVPMHVLP